MGPIGTAIGHMGGTYIAKRYLGDDYKGQSAIIGGIVGNALLPFKNGGKVPGKKGKPKIILAHSGEWVLPNGISPTKEQISSIEKRKKQKREKKVELFV